MPLSFVYLVLTWTTIEVLVLLVSPIVLDVRRNYLYAMHLYR